MATTELIARYSREHNGANVLTLGATLVTAGRGAGDRVDVARRRAMREPRYIRRLAKIRDLESGRSEDRTEWTVTSCRRLIDVIVSRDRAAGDARPPAARCACHAVLDDCCPDRLRGVIDAGATRVGLHASGGAPRRCRR